MTIRASETEKAHAVAESGASWRRRDAGATRVRWRIFRIDATCGRVRNEKSRSRYRVEVVAVAGQHGEAWALDAHLNGVIRLRVIGLGGRVGERVLVARLLRDAGIEPFEVLAARAVENVSSGRMGVFRKNVVSQESNAAVEIRLADADGVHGNIRGKQQLECFIVAVRIVLGVLSVRNQKNNFAPLARAVAQLFRRGVYGVVDVFEVGMSH